MSTDIGMLLTQADTARDRGDHLRSAELAAQAAEEAERAGDSRLAAEALARLALNEVRLGDLVAATATGHRALACCAKLKPDSTLSRVHSTLSLAYERAGLYPFAVAHANQAAETARSCRDAVAECWALVRLGTAEDGSSGTHRGLEHLAQAVDRARLLGDPVLLFAALNNSVRRWVVGSDEARRRGEDPTPALRQALALAEEASQLASSSNSAFIAATSLANLASIHRRLGHAGQSLEQSGAALELALRHGYHGLAGTLRLKRALMVHQQEPSAAHRFEIQQLLDAEPPGGSADPDLLLEAHQTLIDGYRREHDLDAAITQMALLNKALLGTHRQRLDLQSRLLFNQSALDKATYRADLAQHEARLQMLRADAEHELASRLAASNERLEHLVEARTAELAKAKLAAESASRAKSRFLSTLSHELHTPLNGLIGMVGLAMDRPDHPDQAKYLRMASDAAWKLNELFDNMLDFVAADLDAPAAPSPTDLRQLLQTVRQKRSAAAQQKGIGVVVDLDGDLPARVSVDAGRLSRILDVLLDNAIKFSTQGPVRLAVRLTPGTASPAELCIDVIDRGIGASPEVAERLFQAFEMGDDSNTRLHGGVGIGLALARRLAVSLGGQIGVRANPVQGSTFWVRLPIHEARAADSPT